MNEINKTLFIPLYGKAFVSSRNLILNDPAAEQIWQAEGFPLRGKARSKWLAYNMAMRARVFDDWTDRMLQKNRDALVLHVGCGLDSRYRRITQPYALWLDCDLPDVIAARRNHYAETPQYRMLALDATIPGQIALLPESRTVIVVLEGISMYLSNEQLREFFKALQAKYGTLHILMDIYTNFGAKASKYKNPVNDLGVTTLYGVDDIGALVSGLRIHFKQEHSFTPANLVDALNGFDRAFFKLLFTGSLYKKIYRLVELTS